SCFYRYSPSTGEEKKFYHLTVRGESKTPLSNTFMTCDNANRLWYSSWAGIIAIKDKMGTDDLHLPIDRKNELMIPYPMATAFFQAKNGDFWLGHGFGACVHSMSMEAVTRITLPRLTSADVVDLNSIRSICPGPEPGDLFIGSDEGLYWQHEKSQTLTHHQIGSDIFENDVISLHKVGSEIYCCTRRGLFSFDPATHQFRKLNWMDEEFSETGVYKMIEYGDDLWFLCRYSRLYCYHKKTGRFDKFEPREGDKSAIPGNYMPFMELSDEGIVWLIGAECISWMDPADTIFHTSDFFGGQRKYGNTNVNSVLKMGDEIWFSTNYEGVYVIDCNHKTCKPLEHEEIQNLTSRVLLCTDPAGNTWMGSAKGVFIYSKGNPHLEPYLLERSLAMGERHLVGVNMPDGRIAVASNFEALVLDGGLRPDVLRIAPPVVSLVSSTDTVALFLDRDILFDSDRNHFSFQFSTPSATGISFVEYQYRIEGIDDQWIDAGRKNSAFYGNLSGGDYVVWVRARSGKGPWVQMIRPLKITISKKYYETIWFKSALALILVFLLIVVVRRRKAIERAADRQKALKHFVEMKGIPSMGALQSDVINAVTNQLRFVWCMVVFKENEGHYVVAQSTATPQNLRDTGEFDWAADADDIMKRLTQSGDNSVLVKPLSGDENQLGWIIAGGHKEDNAYTADAATVNDIASVAAAMVASSLNENEIKRKEELLAEVNALLSESQLVSLRAQMNPHFVFNCLNSIQESIVMKQYAEASLYLNKFSKLFRMVLQNSSRSLISLEDEINVLTLYLELEHMRFQRSFDYRIDADEDLDISDIQVPSMLIQPFVENALWHGLMHKPSDRKLVIRFYPVSDDVFICEVEDNGIGRKKAGEIKAERNKTISHESKGINISTDRLRLISLQQGKQAAVRFEDLYDADGNAAGTRVVFELSMYLN
ncbi:MAG: histidine kinase, partial [Flavobacteriales bacterium]|nr:histidine kinase [Flavobacteriales bacterium]